MTKTASIWIMEVETGYKYAIFGRASLDLCSARCNCTPTVLGCLLNSSSILSPTIVTV